MASKSKERLQSYIWFSTIFLASCIGGPNIDNFNAEDWKSDKYGCKNQRLPLVKPLLEQKSDLIGLHENKILSFLGRPDKNELYTKDQKFYTYFVTPAINCNSDDASEESEYIQMRFNAVGFLKDIKFVESSE